MSSKMARRTLKFFMATTGMYKREPRLIHYGAGFLEGRFIVGSVDVNTNATTPFSRGKVHKGTLCCTNESVADGDMILDRYDNKRYFIMSKKGKLYNEETAWIDATLYMCDTQVLVERFEQGVRDTFGRPTVAAPVLVTPTPVWIMTNPKNYDILQQKDRLVAQNKIELCLQSSVEIKESDRIVKIVYGPNNEIVRKNMYVVQTVDDTSLINLVLCGVDTDVR